MYFMKSISKLYIILLFIAFGIASSQAQFRSDSFWDRVSFGGGFDGVDQAINHINKYGSSHTDTIVTKNIKVAKKFLLNVKSSIAIHNASTQFADGGEFGFGAEVGISTNKLHPRGPVGIEQLTSYKYILEGKGQIRK